jgi:hypothetical protein
MSALAAATIRAVLRARGWRRLRAPIPREQHAGPPGAGGPYPARRSGLKADGVARVDEFTTKTPRSPRKVQSAKRHTPSLNSGALKFIMKPRPLREFEIRDDLGLVQACKRFDSLDLDDQRFFDQQVDPVACIERDTLVREGKRNLSS